MRNKAIVAISIAAAFSAVALTGCSGFGLSKKSTLDAPIVTRYGSLFTWNEVDGANKYILSYGDSESETTETICHIDNIEAGGTFTLKAVKADGSGKIKEFSETVNIEIDAISVSGQKYAEYTISSGSVTVPSTVEKAVVYGDSTTTYNHTISIEKRVSPLIIELYDVNCRSLSIEGGENRPEECIVIRSLGIEGSMFSGTSGADGAEGIDGGGHFNAGGAGGNGKTGKSGGEFQYVVFEGNKPITFVGGNGGDGGKGGVAKTGNSKGGNGGDGGNGGVGLQVTNAYVMPGVSLTYTGGAGGNGGNGGSGMFLWLDHSGSHGNRGAIGKDFVGTRTDVTYSASLSGTSKTDGDSQTDIVGTYYLAMMIWDNEIKKVGDVKNEETGERLEKTDIILEINVDKTCSIVVGGETGKKGTWDKGDNLLLLSLESEFLKGNVENGVITLTDSSGATVILSRSV